ncbi:MAG: hypothetical protein AAF363_00270 [Bacteroidota bacterium]
MSSTFRYFIILIGFITTLNSCSGPQKEEADRKIIGKWKALWTTDPSGYPENLSETKKFTMNGEIEFNEDGKITINAYGYEDCIFSSDTMNHTLNWKIQGDTMNFFSGEDPYGIPYQIQKLESNNVELLLMEDIKLSLTKK